MGKTIYKYTLNLGTNEIQMPLFSRVLTCQMQGGTITIWALVDPLQTLTKHTFFVGGAGHKFPESITVNNYIGTVQDGAFIWHVFFLNP